MCTEQEAPVNDVQSDFDQNSGQQRCRYLFGQPTQPHEHAKQNS